MKNHLTELKKTFEGIIDTLKNEECFAVNAGICQTDKEQLFSIIDESIKHIKTQIEYINSLLNQ